MVHSLRAKVKPLTKNSKISPVRKVTHLYLNDKFITTLEDVLITNSLTVLYLHNNNINQIQNLNAALNLTTLYLQKNKISKIENLDNLKNLRKLYIGYNEISVVEGLENLTNLEELHIEKQRLNGDSLCFDPRSIQGIASTLQVLNVSHNNVTSIFNLRFLKYIKLINVSYNKLNDIKNICDTISNWYYLYEATFVGNPIVKQHRYRENLIGCTARLTILDNKQVSETTRCFIKRFEQERLNRRSKQSINLADTISNLPKNYPLPVQKAISQSILKNTKPCFDDSTLNCDVADIYLPWKSLPKSGSTKIGRNFPHTKMQKNISAGKILALSTVTPQFK